MKRMVIIGGLIAVTVAVGGAAAWWYGNSRAEREVRQVVAEAGLGDDIAYDRVAYNPLTGAVVIHEIRAIGDAIGAVQPRAAALEILDWPAGDSGVQALHVRLTGLQLAVKQAARAQFEAAPQLLAVSFTDPPQKIFDHPLQALVVLGYDRATLGGELAYRYDPQAETLSLALKVDGREMGAVDLDLALAGVSQKLMEILAGLAETHFSGAKPNVLESLQMLSTLKPEFYRIGLVDLGWSYIDAGLFRRFKTFSDLQTARLPGEPSTLEMSEDDVNQGVMHATQVGLDATAARANVKAVAAFTRDPRRLALITRIAEPIRIAPLFDGPGATLAATVNKLNTLLGLELTN